MRKGQKKDRSQADYAQFIRVAWTESNDRIQVDIPDKIRFPGDIAYMWMHDAHTIKLAHDRPSVKNAPNAVAVRGTRKDITPGCRSFVLPGVKLKGRHFRIMPTSYEAIGDVLAIKVPDEENRLPPKRTSRFRGKAATPAKKEEPVIEVKETTVESVKPQSSLHVGAMIFWTEIGVPQDVVLQLPLEVAAELGKKYGVR